MRSGTGESARRGPAAARPAAPRHALAAELGAVLLDMRRTAHLHARAAAAPVRVATVVVVVARPLARRARAAVVRAIYDHSLERHATLRRRFQSSLHDARPPMY